MDVAAQASIGLSALPAPLLKGHIEADETYIGGYRKGWNERGAGKVGGPSRSSDAGAQLDAFGWP